MRKYNVTGPHPDGDIEGISLINLLHLTDWSEDEADEIADLKPGEKREYDNGSIIIERTS